ncbi:hypothetical protein QUF99_11080 [Bacillus sp. DX4.1]|uniref:hypothetical protein n=1 Tax=Bacillus sp. DX4.1 TaxID=3055867 RepID=UPI0025A045CE|nr:hypothetical protein [Bacillus sp. DX4.1]MDM5187852.1 hypothetical protein [Bacillus sp. DX4.1]
MSNDKNKITRFNESASNNSGTTIRGLGTTKITKGRFNESASPIKKINNEKKQGK